MNGKLTLAIGSFAKLIKLLLSLHRLRLLQTSTALLSNFDRYRKACFRPNQAGLLSWSESISSKFDRLLGKPLLMKFINFINQELESSSEGELSGCELATGNQKGFYLLEKPFVTLNLRPRSSSKFVSRAVKSN